MKKKWKWIFTIVLISSCLLITGCHSNNNLKSLTLEQLEKKIEKQENFIVAVIQTGCSACQSYEPIYSTVLSQYDLEAYTINLTDLTQEETDRLDQISYVSGTPTTLFFTKGKLENSYHKLVGSATSDALKNRLEYLGFIEEK